MENQFPDEDNTTVLAEALQSPQKKKIGLPLAALLLDFASLLFVAFVPLLGAIALLLCVLSPCAGVMMGIVALAQGKERSGTTGMVTAGIAVALPIVVVVTSILLFTTGAVVLGM